MSRVENLASYRWSVASRAAAAIVGGYALTSAATVLLGLIWPGPRAVGLMWATLLSFTVYAVAIMWVFTTRSATRAWIGMILVTLVFTALAALVSLLQGSAGP